MQKYKKILLATMSFNIGGAETHILELAIGLKDAGFIPIVVSNGGVYEEALKEKGIKHYQIPLHNKNPMNMLRSYRILRKLILEEKIDIVHAHARIPGFILGILQDRMKFPFVTSVHGLFSTAWLYKMNSNWGQASIAVSEDLKQYLVDYYHVPEENIVVTVNGISTEKFSKEVDTSSIVKEFQIDPSKKIISHVSRLEESTSFVAKELIAISEGLYEAYKDSQILIVGDGSEYEALRKNAEVVNKKLGLDYIKMVGGRTDINQFTALSDVFIGVSRAALEAMSAECPCIIAGDEGYIGIFTEDKLEIAQQCNFTCRQHEKLQKDTLKKDLLTLLNLTEEEKQTLVQYGRKIIKEYYSVERMVQDNIKIYNRVLS